MKYTVLSDACEARIVPQLTLSPLDPSQWRVFEPRRCTRPVAPTGYWSTQSNYL